METIDLLTLPSTAQQELLDFYQFLIEKNKMTKRVTTIKTDFKSSILNAPKIKELEIEYQQDYPKNIEL